MAGGRWEGRFQFTGFWTDDAAASWTPPERLRAFLAAGRPPVVLTMGSMVMLDPERLLRDVVAALQRSSQRGLVVGGWSGIRAAATADVLCIEEVPYGWLFPRAGCVIHHGGTGTVGAVLRASRPSVVLPQIACQVHYGHLLAAAHLATGAFEAETLDPEALAGAIRRALVDPAVLESTRRWQRHVSGERGIEAAADLIEAHRDRLAS